MRRIAFGLSALFGFFSSLLPSANAADFSFNIKESNSSSHKQVIINLTGVIVEGDADRLKDIIAQSGLDGGNDYHDLVLSLDSLGGSYSEAIELLDVAYWNGVGTYVGPNAECLSACAIVFFGGSNVDTQIRGIDRVLHPKGRLGIHAPSINVSAIDTVPGSFLTAAYAAALNAIGSLVFRKDRLQIPDNLITEMLATPPSEMYYIDRVAKANAWNIRLDIDQSEWVADNSDINSICANFKFWREGHFKDPAFFDEEYNTRYESQRNSAQVAGNNSSNVRKSRIRIAGQSVELNTVLYDSFFETSCFAYQTGPGAVVNVTYSTSSQQSVVQQLQTRNLVDGNEFAYRQHALSPPMELSSIDLPSNRLTLNEGLNDPNRERGWCEVYSNGTRIDREPCLKFLNDGVFNYRWPSGSITVLDTRYNEPRLNEPPRDCRRLQLLSRRSHYEQDNEQIFT